ncbi:hypothetical protein NQ317_013315 [Molorchus minor]|uniref:superoxide dismutase n=1 Tax=Molorchus minor TaxID=1323400 RepID=A0ABQ9JBR4_9CUCU|nr:hypothetical protein NQ317_013315 [Molorchus minor]
MSATKIEFAVQMTCDSCVEAVKKSLENVAGIKSVDVDLKKGSVVVDSNLSTLDLQKRLESTGRKVAVKGYSGSVAAVSLLEAGRAGIQGVIRFVQANPKVCIIDGTIDGLNPGPHHISIHETGDLSQGCESVGDIFNKDNENGRVYGDLGRVTVENNGRADFRLEDNTLKLSDVIGRSFVVAENGEGKRLVCGIIARSAGLFQKIQKLYVPVMGLLFGMKWLNLSLHYNLTT